MRFWSLTYKHSRFRSRRRGLELETWRRVSAVNFSIFFYYYLEINVTPLFIIRSSSENVNTHLSIWRSNFEINSSNNNHPRAISVTFRLVKLIVISRCNIIGAIFYYNYKIIKNKRELKTKTQQPPTPIHSTAGDCSFFWVRPKQTKEKRKQIKKLIKIYDDVIFNTQHFKTNRWWWWWWWQHYYSLSSYHTSVIHCSGFN